MGGTKFVTTSSCTVLCSSSQSVDLRDQQTLLPEVICAGLTHEEAKRNAGLTGIEMYVSKWIDSFVRNQDDHIDSKFMEDISASVQEKQSKRQYVGDCKHI